MLKSINNKTLENLGYRSYTDDSLLCLFEILDDAPFVYYPIVCAGRSQEDILQMEKENALPHGWENMSYEDFLVERRKLMAARIKEAFEQLRNNVG